MLGVLAQTKAEKDSVEALVQPVETADRLFQEIQTWQKQVDDLEYKLDFRGQGVRTMEEVQSELSSLQGTKYSSLSLNYLFDFFSSIIIKHFPVSDPAHILKIHVFFFIILFYFDFQF